MRLPLWADAGFAANDGAERDHGRDGDDVRQALHLLGNISDPGRDRFWEQSNIKRSNLGEPVRQRLRLGPFWSSVI
jgi:hypothetical protein